eukprot:scaffold61067_cov19-Tisochrysis_lutea.AAC.1
MAIKLLVMRAIHSSTCVSTLMFQPLPIHYIVPLPGSFEPDPSPFWKPPQPDDPAPSVTARPTIQQTPGIPDAHRQAAITLPGE